MKVGFTGSRRGMTSKQQAALRMLLVGISIWREDIEFHHGDCIGADEQGFRIATSLGNYTTFAHRPQNLAFAADTKSDVIYPRRPYHERNKVIVKECHAYIGTPNTMTEEVRSGTWSTIRMARKTGNPLVIIYPDGGIERNGFFITGKKLGG